MQIGKSHRTLYNYYFKALVIRPIGTFDKLLFDEIVGILK